MNIYEKIVGEVKDNFEKYDLTYTAFRSLVHSHDLCVSLIKEIIELYETLSPSIAGNVPYDYPKCPECGGDEIRGDNLRINGEFWVQDLHCESCHVKFGRFNKISTLPDACK